MKIKFWGTWGSLPSGTKDTAKYGGATACVELRDKNNNMLIIDAGTAIPLLGKFISGQNIPSAHLVFTHFHLDHLFGFPFFTPVFNKDFTLKISSPGRTGKEVRQILDGLFTPPYFPVKISGMQANIIFEDTLPPLFEMQTIPLNHPNGAHGFRFTQNGKTFVFCTDNELACEEDINKYAAFAQNADLLVHDGEYNAQEYALRKGWGHSDYAYAVKLAVKANVNKLGIFHHQPTRTDSGIDAIIKESNAYAKTFSHKPEVFACSDGLEIDL